MNTYKDMIGWDNIFTGKYVGTIMYHMLRTGTNISHRNCRKRRCNSFMGFPIHTHRSVQANKPDITTKNHEEKTCKLINSTFPMDINISAKEFEKLSKY